MRNRHWSPSGAHGSRVMLIAVPLVITMAVGLVLGLQVRRREKRQPEPLGPGHRGSDGHPGRHRDGQRHGQPDGHAQPGG